MTIKTSGLPAKKLLFGFGAFILCILSLFIFAKSVYAAVPEGLVFVYDSRDVQKIKNDLSGGGVFNGPGSSSSSGLSKTKIYAGENISRDKNKRAELAYVGKTGANFSYRTKLTCTYKGQNIRTFITVSIPLGSDFDSKSSFAGSRLVQSFAGAASKDTLAVTMTSGEAAQYSQTPDGDYGKKQSSSCLNTSEIESMPITVSNYQKLLSGVKQAWDGAASASSNRGAVGGSSSGSEDDADQADCDTKGDSPLSWIICPIIDAGVNMSELAFNGFVQPLLKNVPISAKSDDGAFIAWQTFRIFGNVILVGALLMMVFAQNFGRFVDAYTVRKMAPRIVVGAIAINVSYYLCLAAIDITNVIGTGLGQLIVAPFAKGFVPPDGVPIPSDISSNLTAGLIGTIGALGVGMAIWGSIGAIGASVVGLVWLLLPFILTVTLIALAVVFTLVIRMALIVFLTVVSGVAVALFILPSTEQYFRKWWDLFVKTLIMYPIITALFAVSNIMTIILLSSANAGGGTIGVAQVIAAIFVAFAPIALVPFSFKFAGGALAAVMNASQGFAQRASTALANTNAFKGRRDYNMQRAADARLQTRAQRFRNLNQRADTEGARGRRFAGFMANRLNGPQNNLLARESEMQARKGKEINDTIASGDDTQIRAYTANLRQAERDRANNVGNGQTWRTNDQGQLEVQSAAGKWVSRQAAIQARQEYGENNTAAYQAAMAYEMRKATTQEEHDSLINNFARGVNERGMTAEQANGVWIGAAFANQNEDRQWKYHSWQTDENGGVSHAVNGLGLMREIDEKQGSYASQMQNADTWTTMSQEVGRAQQTITDLEAQARGGPLTEADQQRMDNARETVTRAARIADGLSSGGYNITDPDTGEVRQAGAGVGAGAPGRVAEEMKAFSEIAGAAGRSQGFDDTHYGTPVRGNSENQAVDDRTRPGGRDGRP